MVMYLLKRRLCDWDECPYQLETAFSSPDVTCTVAFLNFKLMSCGSLAPFVNSCQRFATVLARETIVIAALSLCERLGCEAKVSCCVVARRFFLF